MELGYLTKLFFYGVYQFIEKEYGEAVVKVWELSESF